MSRLTILVLAASTLWTARATSTDYVWLGTTSNSWGTNTNWSPSSAVPTNGDTITFNSSGNGRPSMDIFGFRSIQSITVDTATAASYTITSGNGAFLTFDPTGAAITVTSTVTQNQSFNAPIVAQSGGITITNNSTAATLTFAFPPGSGSQIINSGGAIVVTGSGNTIFNGSIGGILQPLNKSGAGTLSLNSTVATQGINITGGTLLINGTYNPTWGSGTTIQVSSGMLGGTGTIAPTSDANASVTIPGNGIIRGDSDTGTGTLTINARLLIQGSAVNGGMLRTFANRTDANIASNSLISVIGGKLLQFSTSAGKFQISVDMPNWQPNETYTLTLGQVNTAGNIWLGNTTQGAKAVIAASNYTASSPNMPGFVSSSLFVDNTATKLQFTFTTVPEPSLLMLLAGIVSVWTLRLRR
ncbi:hypothetical protein BH11PLA2_BH11PLA2_35990 [soil metagenome]